MLNPCPETDTDPIDDALQTFPAAPVPAGLSPTVMGRIQALSPAPRFRMPWIDYAVGLVAAGTAALALMFWYLIPSQFVQSTQYRAVFLLQQYSQSAMWPALVGGLALTALAIAGTAILILVAASLGPPKTR